MTSETELKPCPFCGREAVIKRGSCGYYAECNNGMCKVMPTTWYYETEKEAITAWNRRKNNDND